MTQSSTSRPAWVTTLRQAIKAEHGRGWTIREMSGRIQLTRRYQDGTRSNATLPLPWDPDSLSAALAMVSSVRGRMESRNLSLQEAARLESGSTATPSGKVNWPALIEVFHEFKVNGAGHIAEDTWRCNYAYPMRLTLSALNSSPAPRDGRALLEAIRDELGCEPGSRGRQTVLRIVASLLRFGVEQQGLPSRWLPPTDMGGLIGKRKEAKPDSTPLRDADFLRLLDSITDPGWRLAIGLLGCFGLRPVELRYLKVSDDGQRLVVSYQKRNSSGSTRPREVMGIDPVGAPGLSAQLLATLQASTTTPGIAGIPNLGTRQGNTSTFVHKFLFGYTIWPDIVATNSVAGEHLTCYGFRHGFALRCHEAAGLSPRVAAALMGHSLLTHSTSYGRWTDRATIEAAVNAGRGRVASMAS